MRIAVALGSLALASTAVIAGACAGFSSEETTAIADSGADSGAVDAGVSEDAADVKWAAPVKQRDGHEGTLIIGRLAHGSGDFYFSESAYPLLFNSTMFRRADNDAGTELASGDVSVRGASLSVFQVGAITAGLFERDGILTQGVFDGSAFNVTGTVTDAGVALDPYVNYAGPDTKTYCYASTKQNNGVARWSFSLENAASPWVPVEVHLFQKGSKVELAARHPVATSDEKTIYFSAPDLSQRRRIWSATRSNDPATLNFVDARLVEFEGSTDTEFPTGLSGDGTELYFTREVPSDSSYFSSAVYSIKQLK